MREEIREFAELGPLPSQEADVETIMRHEEALLRIARPVTDEEAKVLIQLFGPDDCYGLAWVLLHLIETAPNLPIDETVRPEDNEWVRRIKIRIQNKKRWSGLPE
ncbi:MAG TPA: hypothetical protein VER55_08790 [Ardenticatenaceae bacterium]|nr:hypothetical protein [Ardenticatenaceae bacterium]